MSHLHYSSPYRELEDARTSGVLADILADPADVTDVERALDSLEVPSDFGTAGILYVTHAPTIGTHRDADVLTRSNYRVVSDDILEDYANAYGRVDGTDYLSDEDEPDTFIGRARHWAVGWTESVAVRPFVRTPDGWTLTDAMRSTLDWADALRDYPVADESDLSELELEELTTWLEDELPSAIVPDVLEGLHARGLYSPDDVRWAELEDLTTHALAERVEPMLETMRAYVRLRAIGNGQLDIWGAVVTVPDAPTRADVETVLELIDATSLTREYAGSDNYASLLDLADVLYPGLTPAYA